MANVKIQHEGKDLEVALPEGYLAPDEVRSSYVAKDYHEKEIGRVSERFKNAKRDEFRQEFEADESFIQSIVQKHGKKGQEVDLKAHQQQWESEKLKPLQERTEKLLSRVRNADIIQAAQGLVKDEYLKPPLPGRAPFIVSLMADMLEHDEEHGFIGTEDGKRLPGSSGRLYANASDVLERLKGSDSLKYLWKEAEQTKGSGYKGSNGTGAGSKTMNRVDFLKLSPAAQMEFSTGGGTLTE